MRAGVRNVRASQLARGCVPTSTDVGLSPACRWACFCPAASSETWCGDCHRVIESCSPRLTHVDWRPEHLRRTYHGADRMPPVVSLAARSTLRWCPRFEACTPPGRAQFTQGSREVVHRVSGFGQGRSCATRRLIEDIDSPWHKRRAKPLIRPFPHRFERLAHDSLGQIS